MTRILLCWGISATDSLFYNSHLTMLPVAPTFSEKIIDHHQHGKKTPHDDLMIKIRIWLNIKEHLSRGKSSHQTIYPLHTISRMYFTPHIFPPFLVTLPPLKIQTRDLLWNYLKRAMKGADKDPKLHFQGFILWHSQNPWTFRVYSFLSGTISYDPLWQEAFISVSA